MKRQVSRILSYDFSYKCLERSKIHEAKKKGLATWSPQKKTMFTIQEIFCPSSGKYSKTLAVKSKKNSPTWITYNNDLLPLLVLILWLRFSLSITVIKPVESQMELFLELPVNFPRIFYSEIKVQWLFVVLDFLFYQEEMWREK